MIQVNNVTKRFGSLVAINNVSLTIPHGQVVGLLGPNGAGKTTLFKLIAGFLHPDAGQIQFSGAARRVMGFKPERLLYPNQLRVSEYLALVSRLSHVERAGVDRAVMDALKRVKLADAAGKRIKDCSKGMRQRLGMAQILIGRPALLMIDEPTDGLDPEGQADICRLIRELGVEGHTIVLSSHQLHEVTQVCTRIAILNRGKVHYESSLADALAIRPHVTIQVTQDLGPICDPLKALHPQVQVERATITLTDEAIGLRRQILRMVLEAGLDVRHVEQKRATLEEIYAEVVR